MNVNRTALFAALALLAASAASADPTAIGKRIREVPDAPVEVEIWTDRGDGARYCAGESIEIYFRTNVDAFVAIYDIDTRGRTHQLFPSRHNPDNFVYGGRVNRLESRYGYHFEVEGPTGWETLRAVASTDPHHLGGHYRDQAPARYPQARPARPTRGRAVSSTVQPAPSPRRITEVPDDPYDVFVAVDEARHFVRDGYRCRPRPTRPWWRR
ncbi:MAG: DUF4384 domain-containing protein [bacterium]|nr:DUF4384 domain-containing protein [bacterium]